jgi:hypothetical protein
MAAIGAGLAVVISCIVLLALAAHSRTEAPAMPTQPAPTRMFTAHQKQTWETTVYRPLFPARQRFGGGLGSCNERYHRGTSAWARCATPGIVQLATRIELSEIAAKAMVSGVTGNCRAKLQTYIASLDTAHSRTLAFWHVVEQTHDFPVGSLLRWADNLSFFVPAIPTNEACVHPPY